MKMIFVWDEVKRQVNLDKHGLDFVDVPFFDWETAILERSHSRRIKAIGYYRDGTAVVVYAELGREALSIISFRDASPRERKRLP